MITQTKIKVIETGETKIAVYAPNSAGNMRYNVDGKFYSDKKFNQMFEIEQEQTFTKSEVLAIIEFIRTHEFQYFLTPDELIEDALQLSTK